MVFAGLLRSAIALDLDDVASRTGLTPAQVVELHSSTTYHVYMLGFLPGMAYLGDVPAELGLPRRTTPRLHVPAGSLAIATTMTCVYPLDTPAGWHLIGRSPVPFWEQRPVIKTLLTPGDRVTFMPVSLASAKSYRSRPPPARCISNPSKRRWR